ncbi:energy transducer TonB [Undibacterium sp. Di26W]|uniref:energy transducer TonB n=1 Tax=Undibacterium sp. Di26W TaxID=3413035 RepID=UPI003BF33187
MLKNKISASCFVLLTLFNLRCEMANAQSQTESKVDANNEKSGQAQDAGPEKTSLLDRCKKPEYSRGVTLYGLEGKTVVDFGTNSAGRVMMAEISRSSGWRILDEAVLMTIIGCKIYENPGTGKTYTRANYVWHIEDSLEKKPEVLADTCNKSEFVSLAKDDEPGRGIVVGVRLNMDGTIEKTSLEWALDPKLNEESIKLVNSCKFKPGMNNKRNRPSSISLRLLPLRSN